MRFGLWPDLSRPWAELTAMADLAESTGWDRLYTYDHFMPHTEAEGELEGPVLEGWTVLTAYAARTSRIRLGTLVLGNLYRHPAVLANMAATLDHVSGGRLVLGIGAGWQQNEHDLYGIELTQPRPRLDQFEEACSVIESLLHQPRTTFSGTYYQISDAPCEPKPLQRRLPLLIGGRGEKRTMRIAARYADEWNAWTTPEQLRHKNSVLDQHCEQIGRDPARISRSTQALVTFTDSPAADPVWLDGRTPCLTGTEEQLVEAMAAYAEAGADEFILPDDASIPLGQRVEQIERFRLEVAAAFH